MSQFGTRARSFFERAFPERQIYHRSGGSVRYIALSPSKQVLIALGAVGIAGWCAYATLNTVMSGSVVTAKQEEADRVEQKYQRWLRESRAREAAAEATLEERTEGFERTAEELIRRHDTLKLLLDYSGGSTFTAAARPVQRDGAKILMQASIDEADPRASREPAQMEAYHVQTVNYRGKLEKLKAEQATLLASVEDRAVRRAEEIRGVLRLTGVGFTRLTEEGGVGGPELPIDVNAILGEENADPGFVRRFSQVAARVKEANELEQIANSTPLAPPVGVEHRETSGFGPRFDPFTRRPAFHAGLDLAAFERAPVIAAAPGKVTFSGVKAGFGNFIEIDHGHGFKTRYAHLSTIEVGLGEQVALGRRIGSMGSTGRSTGTHLHYEVMFRNRVYDPVYFLRAGQHVYEQG
jgi:murein DD-endopeptidase MepM/ murein hydrolase activator NlpD